jgi:hypothetical protein
MKIYTKVGSEIPYAHFLIRALNETDWETGEPLYWSNDLGWVDKASATMFVNDGGVWSLFDPWEAEQVV